MFRHSNHKYININTFKKMSFWSEKIYTNKWKSYTIESLLSAINFLLDNTYIKFGPFIFQQINGNPMGSNCSALLADLYLSWLEYEFMQKLIKSDFSLAKKLSFNARYIDDIACINILNFIEIAKEIYPIEIPLNINNSDCLHDAFLDLDIRVFDNKFVTKFITKLIISIST